MRNVLAPGVASSATNPVLDFWAQVLTVDGDCSYYAPAVPYALAFQVWDVRNEDAPAQVFPTTPGQRHTVDLTADAVAGMLGRYAAAYTTGAASTKGRYQIRWYYTPTVTDTERVVAYDFDMLPAAAAITDAGLGYALPSDMRAEGVTLPLATDAFLIKRIALASQYVERVTGRSFMPTFKTLQMRMTDEEADFGEPIIALSSVDAGGDALDPTTFRVANRHLAVGLIDPDDRENPSLDIRLGGYKPGIVSTGSFPLQVYGYTAVGGPWWFNYRRRHVTATGLFGYTEFDGSPTGRTPKLITHVTKLLVMRELAQMASPDRENRNRWRLTGETVRDQSYTLTAALDGGITGDREIDDILARFSRPMRIASV